MTLVDDDPTGERQRFYDALQRAAVFQQRGETDVDQALRELNEATVASIPGARYAGITLVDEHGQVTSVGATHDFARMLDDLQGELREGPCLSAAWENHTMLIDDLEAEQRWPLYCREVTKRTPVRSVLSVQLDTPSAGIAALNFQAEAAGSFDEDAAELARVFAAHTTLAWNSLHRERQFQTALGSRDLIGQAKGMLMERFNIDGVAAFDALRHLSQDMNVKLIDVAERIVSAGPDRP